MYAHLKQKVRYADIFGTRPQLFVNKEAKFNTWVGTTLSIVLFVSFIIALWVYGKDLYFKMNPSYIFTEESTDLPEKFIINKDTFNFSFGLQTKNWTHFSDPSVYYVKFYQYNMEVFTDEEGNRKQISQYIDLNARKCTKQDFGITKQYFQNLEWLDQLYCVDNYSKTKIEGDYGLNKFSGIIGKVFPCKNSTESQIECKPQLEIDSILKDMYWAIYISDTIMDLKDYKKPFKPIGRNVYGICSGKIFKNIDFYLRNIFLDDNTGLIFDSWNKQRGIQFQSEKEYMKIEPEQEGQFLQFMIRLEKVKQTRIYRTYLNLAVVLANVGGVLKFFYIVFFIFCYKHVEKQYNLKLANQIFNFEFNQTPNKGTKGEQNDLNKNLKPKCVSRFLSLLGFFQFKGKQKSILENKMLQYSEKKLKYHLDIKRILQKLIEVDKLKLLLLNQEQMHLFEYLPKPVITDQMVLSKQESGSLVQLKKSQNYQIQNNDYDVLFEDTRSSEERKNHAFQAFKHIYYRDKRGKIDEKILKIMDKNLFAEFKNSIDGINNSNQLSIRIR